MAYPVSRAASCVPVGHVIQKKRTGTPRKLVSPAVALRAFTEVWEVVPCLQGSTLLPDLEAVICVMSADPSSPQCSLGLPRRQAWVVIHRDNVMTSGLDAE